MRKILVLDNYDSFTYNLVHIIRALGYGGIMDIFRNDKIALQHVADYTDILLSPGPGIPKDAGIMPDLIKKFAESKNILGVCLGHQAIGEAFGADLYNLPVVYHGVTTPVMVEDDKVLYQGIPDTFTVCRYHSWVIAEEGFPDDLVVTAKDQNGQIMGIKHRKYQVRGVQYHPESIMTEHGIQMIKNWLKIND
jgi:anthranilate synthase component 2